MIKDSSIKKISEYLEDTKSLNMAVDRLALYKQMQDNCMTTKKRSYDTIIASQETIIQNLQLQVKRDKCDLSRLVSQEEAQFYVFYLHIVKRKTLRETARLTSYSKDGVVAILRRIRNKCTQIKRR